MGVVGAVDPVALGKHAAMVSVRRLTLVKSAAHITAQIAPWGQLATRHVRERSVVTTHAAQASVEE